jgi:hypothetical protein
VNGFHHEEADMGRARTKPMPQVEWTAELKSAVADFRRLLDPAEINARQTHASDADYTPFVVTWLMILQRLAGNASLSAAVAALLAHPAWASTGRRITAGTLSANSGAYSRARQRLEVDLAEGIADEVCARLMSSLPPSWGARRVFLVDGTTLPLSSDDGLRAAYPPASNQHGDGVWPILHLAVAHDLASGCALRPETGAMYGPQAVSELTLAERLLGRLPAGSVLLADRNFGVFSLIHAAVAAGHDTVTRLTEVRFRALVRTAQPAGPGRWTLDWRPSAADRRNHAELPADACVAVELHEVRTRDAEGQELALWIVTTLMADGAALAELYHQRQDVETDIRNVKVALKLNELRGRSVSMLQKELALGMTAYNLIVQIRRLAAQQAGVPARKLSFTGTWSLVLPLLINVAGLSDEEYAARFALALRGSAQRAIPTRPGRSYPREQWSKSKKHPNRSRPKEPATPR